jgi:protease-4
MTDPSPPQWERAVLERVALQAVQEQRRARHWNILFRLLFFTLAFLVLGSLLGWFGRGDKDGAAASLGKHTAVIDLEGIIGVESKASAEKMVKALNRAFKDPNTQGVILRINSPGGSPVQSGYINDEMRRLRAKHPNIPLYAVVQDLCASGGYYVAVGADRIYVDKASLVGSIGVIMGSFGFTGAMDKLGVERRVYTAGANKDFLDPFQKENPAHAEHAKRMAAEIHEQFIRVVRQGRGKRLKETDDTYSGLIWTGEKSIELGLADALGSTEYVAREVVKAERLVDFTPDENYFEALSKRLGASAGVEFARAVMQASGGSLPFAR